MTTHLPPLPDNDVALLAEHDRLQDEIEALSTRLHDESPLTAEIKRLQSEELRVRNELFLLYTRRSKESPLTLEIKHLHAQQHAVWTRYLSAPRSQVTAPVRVRDVPEKEQDPSLWELFSEHITARAPDRFMVRSVLEHMRKHMDWTPLVDPGDLKLLRKYGFDQEGLRRLRNKKVRVLEAHAVKNLPTFATVAELTAFFAKELPAGLDFPAYFAPIAARFTERWERRCVVAHREPDYSHKRHLEAIETELAQNKRARTGEPQ
jgi:hypothetical protein